MKIIVQESEKAIKTLHLLSNLTVKNIVDYLKENGPTSPSKIAKGLNISPSTSSRCLQDMRKFNIVKAEWKMESIDDRPEKIYQLVPNILRFEFVLAEPNISSLNPDSEIIFSGNSLTEYKEGDEKSVYVSLESVPFRFQGLGAEIVKDCSKNWSFGDLKEKYMDNSDEFEKIFRKLLTLGLVEMRKTKQE
jgi:predicted DNA-binding ArsR family transcriptional regulator